MRANDKRATDGGDYHRGMGRNPRKEARHFNCSFCGITFWGEDRIWMYISHVRTRCSKSAMGRTFEVSHIEEGQQKGGE